MLEETAALPGAESAGLTQGVPLSGFAQSTRVTPQEQPDKAVDSTFNSVSPGFFDTLGIKPLQGRLLGEQVIPAVRGDG